MIYTLNYNDPNNSMTTPNNPTSYNSLSDGVIILTPPSLTTGEFRGWFKSYSSTTGVFSDRITQLDQDLGQTSTLTIYAYVQVDTQLQVLGSQITDITDLSHLDGKHVLLTNSINANTSRSLSSITPTKFSDLITSKVDYILATTSSITANLESVRQEYYIDLANIDDDIDITISHPTGANCILFHFTRGSISNIELSEFKVTITGITLSSGSASSELSLSIGSTLVLLKSEDTWSASVFYNPTLSSVSTILIDDSLKVRNYAYKGNLDFDPTPESSNIDAGRNFIDVVLTDFNPDSSLSSIEYKSVFIQFDNDSYNSASTDASKVILNKKQGYLNLISAEANKLTYNSSTKKWILRITYDSVPAYDDEDLAEFTEDIPTRIMVVI